VGRKAHPAPVCFQYARLEVESRPTTGLPHRPHRARRSEGGAWNTSSYDVAGRGWFVAFHGISEYVKVSYLSGISLTPVPPVDSKLKEVPYFHVHEGNANDNEVLANWIRQAAELDDDKCI
jgi:hypothetical protein